MMSLSSYTLESGAPHLSIEGLSAGYDKLRVLDDVNLSVSPGETLAITGKNGVGKTTLLRAIMGQARIWSGSMMYGGQDLGKQPPSSRAGLGFGYVPQGRRIFPELSGWENLAIAGFGSGRRDWKDEQKKILDYFPSLREYLDRKGGSLSGGQQQLLALARALTLHPSILLLDEPSEGIQPNIVDQLVGVIEQFQSEFGLSVLLVEQNLGLIVEMASAVAIMDRGRIVKTISTGEGRIDAGIIESFLGFSTA